MVRPLLVALVLAAAALVAAGAERPLAPTVAWAHPEPGDEDGDGVADTGDNCPRARNADQRDTDGDAAGDACDEDDDADGVPDAADGCRLDADPDQRDANGTADGDGTGDACEGDRDGDGASDATDICREVPDPGQEDADRDGTGDPCDPDDDDDGVFDDRDNCPRAYNPQQFDLDADGRGHDCDPDDLAAAAPPFDGRAPRVHVRLAAPPRLAASLPVRLRCSEACAARARLLLRRRVVASGSAAVAGAAVTYVFLRFDRRARRALRARPHARLTLRVTVRDRALNARTVTRRVRLRGS
jgi:hypothetical protein